MTNQSTPIIKHFVALVKAEPFENSVGKTGDIAESIVTDLNLNVIKKLSHMFTPQGITIVYILSESHLAVHTWPELGTIHVDLVTCSMRTKEEFEKSLKHSLYVYKVRSIKIKSVDIDRLW